MSTKTKQLIAGAGLVAVVLYVSIFYYKLREPEYVYVPYDSSTSKYKDTREFLPPMECGSGWQEKYADLHKRTLAGENGGRVLVSVYVEGGLADNLSGLMSEFYFALLSNRALQIYNYNFLPPYEPCFESVYFNWSNPGYPDLLTDNLKFTYKGQRDYPGDRSYPPEVDTKENWLIYQMNDIYGQKDTMFTASNLETVPQDHADAKRVFMTSNRGMTYRLAKENPYHKEQFAAMGIRPENMFGCAFRTIFKPTPALIQRNEPYFKILRDPNILKIGIMVRTGDDSFLTKTMTDEHFAVFNSYFSCAEQVEAAKRKAGQPVIWYLLSDSLDLRRKAKVKYGDKVLTDVETLAIHPDCAAHDPATCSHDIMKVALMQATGQLITFAWTDYQVISRWSGFGRVGAVLSGTKEDHIYSLPRDHPCDAAHPDTWQEVANDWAGI